MTPKGRDYLIILIFFLLAMAMIAVTSGCSSYDPAKAVSDADKSLARVRASCLTDCWI